jgi:hypothetical protein
VNTVLVSIISCEKVDRWADIVRPTDKIYTAVVQHDVALAQVANMIASNPDPDTMVVELSEERCAIYYGSNIAHMFDAFPPDIAQNSPYWLYSFEPNPSDEDLWDVKIIINTVLAFCHLYPEICTPEVAMQVRKYIAALAGERLG